MNFTSRKAAVSGLAMLGASALVLAGCAAAPEEGGTAGPTDEALDFLPCIVSDAGGFDDRSFNQAGFEGLAARRGGARRRVHRGRVAGRERLRPQRAEPRRRGLRPDRHGGLPARGGDRRGLRREPRHQLRDHRLGSSRATTSSRSSSTPSRRRSSPATRPRATPRPASSAPSAACPSRPSRSSWTASCRASSTTTRSDGDRRPGPRLGLRGAGRRLHRRLRRRHRGAHGGAGPASTRTSTCCCPSVARSTSRPPRPSATPAVRSPSSASTPTCSRPTRASATCSSPRC